MAEKTNNQISRDVLACLNDHHPKAVKFSDMTAELDIPEKPLFKNLFFLEEISLVQLMSSYPQGATYPTIHMVKIREEGRSLLRDESRMEDLFPLHGLSSRNDIYKINHITLSCLVDQVLKMIAAGEIVSGDEVKSGLEGLMSALKKDDLSELSLSKIFDYLSAEDKS